MSVSLQWQGLREFQAALRNLPEHLGEEAADIIDDTVEVTASSLEQTYPLGDTGKLRKGIKKSVARSRFGASGVVRSTSPHAHLWEFGTEVRSTRKGWPRGRVQPHRGLVAIAQRNRKRMYQQLIEMLKREGFTVSGHA